MLCDIPPGKIMPKRGEVGLFRHFRSGNNGFRQHVPIIYLIVPKLNAENVADNHVISSKNYQSDNGQLDFECVWCIVVAGASAVSTNGIRIGDEFGGQKP